MISSIEKVLLTGESDAGLLEQYPELHCTSLRVQLAMFKSKYDYQSTTEAANTLQNMLPEVLIEHSVHRTIWPSGNTWKVAPCLPCFFSREWKMLQLSLQIKNLALKHNDTVSSKQCCCVTSTVTNWTV